MKKMGWICLLIIGFSMINIRFNECSADSGMEISMPSGVVKLYSPITIDDVLNYRDGGTTGFIITDERGTKFSFCLDGRLHSMGMSKNPKPHHIFIGANHPTVVGAVDIPIGGKDEKIILKILEDWVKSNVSEEQKARFSNQNTKTSTNEENKIKSALRVINILSSR